MDEQNFFPETPVEDAPETPVEDTLELPAEDTPANRKKPWWILIVVAVVLVAVIVAEVVMMTKPPQTTTIKSDPQATAMQVQDVTPTVQKVQNPIDFGALKAKNSDLYAWIKVPGTVIDYPIAQSSPDEEEDFYLHRGEDKSYLFEGTIYTQKYNAKDFSDPNTIVYGHCMKNGTMFRALHDLKVQSVWDATPEFTIYTEGHILTYRIFSAYTRDDRHILVQNDFFKDKAVFADYLEAAAHPTYGMTRECNLTTDDRIVTLETCVTADGNTRFIVSGVLVNDQPTY